MKQSIIKTARASWTSVCICVAVALAFAGLWLEFWGWLFSP
jgi:hypothetical protein